MAFLSVKFLILIIAVLILLKVSGNALMSRLILIAAGYAFYSCFDLSSSVLLIVLSVLIWLGGRIINSLRSSGFAGRSRFLCVLFVCLEVGILCFFKYSGLFPMPIGLSFYMLQGISFIIDSYRGDLAGEYPSLADTLVFIGFFPTIVSGPIMKAREFIPKLRTQKKLTADRLSRGIQLFALGAFMKLVMADRLAVAVDKVYSAPLVYSGLTLFFTSIAYTLQLLFDFAGYSNMAIGTACILGFDLDRNFNLPYLSSGPSEFWKRWHISLSSWLKDYVYIPLGGSRKGKVRTYLNIFLVMIISGLWHGSTVNFLIWGALHGIWQVIHRLIKESRASSGSSGKPGIISMLLTFLMVNLLWIPFRAATPYDAWMIFSRMITFKPGAAYYYIYTFIFGGLMLIVQFIACRRTGRDNPFKALPLGRMYGKIIFCALIIATAMFAYFGNGAFIYANF
ncbi:MAG: hypothetical protein K6F34_05730 [Lachnospiraceae bacterium]|nr:hypothetical protein [Lachnospiraceae bacterium]